MAANKFTTNLNDVPSEVLLGIFKHLHIRDRMAFGQVSSRWSRLLLKEVKQLEFIHEKANKKEDSDKEEKKFMRCLNVPDWTEVNPLLVFKGVPACKWNEIVPFLTREAGQSLQTAVFQGPHQTFENEQVDSLVWTSVLTDHCPNVTSLTILNGRLSTDEFRLLIQKYGNQLEELRLAPVLVDDVDIGKRACLLWFQLLIQFGNPSRLLRLQFPVVDDKSVKTICKKFTSLVRLKVTKWYSREHPVVGLSCRELKQLRFIELAVME